MLHAFLLDRCQDGPHVDVLVLLTLETIVITWRVYHSWNLFVSCALVVVILVLV